MVSGVSERWLPLCQGVGDLYSSGCLYLDISMSAVLDAMFKKLSNTVVVM